MRFILKILAFTALLLISRFTKEDELETNPANSPQVIVSTVQSVAQKPEQVRKTAGDLQEAKNSVEAPVQALVATQATIK